MNLDSKGSLPRESKTTKDDQTTTTNNYTQRLDKYFDTKDYQWFVDDIDKKCCLCCCQDIKKRVVRENQGLGPVVGFG